MVPRCPRSCDTRAVRVGIWHWVVAACVGVGVLGTGVIVELGSRYLRSQPSSLLAPEPRHVPANDVPLPPPDTTGVALATATAPPRVPTEDEGRAEGEASARAELAAGNLIWRELGGWGYPLRVPYTRVSMSQVLERDFRVDVQRTPHVGCIVPRDAKYQTAFTKAFNAVMKPAIERAHGRNVFAIAKERAERETAANKAKHEHCQKNPNACGRDDALTAGGTNCNPPTYVDKHGIKRIKPACM